MNIRKLGGFKPRVLVFQGSPRDKDTCPNMQSKTHNLIEYMVDKWSPFINFEVIDLSVNLDKKPNIQPCKGCVSTAGGFHCHFPCISPNQRVHMIDGFKEIKDIKIGDILQDGNKVINHFMTSPNEKIYELKLTDGRRLELTSNHKVKVLSKDRYRDSNSYWKFYRKEEWLELKDIKIGDNVPILDIDDIIPAIKNEDDILYEIYGLIWGDGALSNDSATLYVDKRETEFIEKIKNRYDKYIISITNHHLKSPKIREQQENITEIIKINFGSKIGKKFKKLFTKSKATERRINFDSFKSKHQIFNFLNGWISTDGSINKNNTINIYNTSYYLLKDFQLILSRIGIRSNITDLRHLSTEIRGKKYQRCSSLTINSQESIDIMLSNLDIINTKKFSKFKSYKDKKRRTNKHSFSKVKSIKEIGYSPVYDIEVENSHEFNCEGIKVHNCSCFRKGSEKQPDLLSELNVYGKLQECDAFVIVSPIHWHALTSQVKLLFDRLVCINQALHVDDAKKLMGADNIKNSEVTGKFARSGKYDQMLRNHIEGKVCAFYVHGDDGANEYVVNELPESFDVLDDGFGNNPKNTVMPYVMQMKYSGVFVPDELIQAFYVNKGIDYYTANKKFNKESEFFERMDLLMDNLLNYLDEKKSNENEN
jgi:intein/homing endonuclease/multimeric flavodoxin WrbA